MVLPARSEVPADLRPKAPGATEKQVAFIRDLLDEKEVVPEDGETIESLKEKASDISKRAASSWIEKLLTLPNRKADRETAKKWSAPSPEELPAGRYAIRETEGDELRFYKVWRGTRNPDYAKVYLLHGPDETALSWKSGATIMKKIVFAGPRDAAITYGREIGACSTCGKRLTNRLSRALGIGPICGGRFWGDDWKPLVEDVRTSLAANGLDPDENMEAE